MNLSTAWCSRGAGHGEGGREARKQNSSPRPRSFAYFEFLQTQIRTLKSVPARNLSHAPVRDSHPTPVPGTSIGEGWVY